MGDGNRAPVSDRGEASLVLAGATMGLRPSFEALDAIEKTLGRGLVDLAGSAIRKELSMSETGQIACELIRAFGRESDDEGAARSNAPRVTKLIMASDGGLLEAMKTIGGVLAIAVNGGYDTEGNMKPPVTTTTDEAPAGG
ncbi:hypothetical protein KCP91_08155 [Microvirga sp. SRT01]|uniref:Uncharacterized protein n=1 Tax=Sphingomonas longa TaxID=2778730 RepID=A0ABS2D633_9SPHN|nr:MULTISPECIES: GTA-gp10 family protein [Alphaproteobacteria]MBM6576343.1 hypothetical protein [Sphingomonas sp. BT552]MBR7709389.1 hypothetical protein [Microvirga sp. SRT01]